MRCTLTVTNVEPVDAVGVTATDDLPEGIDVAGVSSGGVVAEGHVTWTGVDLPTKTTRTFSVQSVVGAATPSGALVNRFRTTNPDGFDPVQVRHPCADDAASSCAQVRLVVPPAAAIGVHKRLVSQSAPDDHGRSTVTYELTVGNTGGASGTYALSDTSSSAPASAPSRCRRRAPGPTASPPTRPSTVRPVPCS